MTLPEALSDERDLSKMGNRYLDASPFDMPNRSTAWMRDPSQAPLPLVIGITGHRDPRPEDRGILEARVRAVFMEIQNRYPATPLILLSPLAEGADQLAARTALDCGARLIVPLPMPQAEYERDFSSAEFLAEFRELLQRADRHFELPWAHSPTQEISGPNGEGRDRAYALLGAYIARNCQILIALWDGKDSGKEGGTAQVVRFKLEGITEPYTSYVKGNAETGAPTRSLIEPAECGPVYHVPTPRVSNPNPTCRTSSPYQPLFPESFRGQAAEKEAYNRIYARINKFNRDWITLAPKLAVKREANKVDLFPDQGEGPLSSPLESIRDHYAMADALAMHYKPLMLGTLKGLFVLVFLAAVAFDLYAHLEALQKPPVLLVYLFLLSGAYTWYLWAAERGDYQNKFQDYRALAEGLRVQFYWRLVGIDDSTDDHYLSKQRSELDWIRNALRIWGFLESQPGSVQASAPSPGSTDRMPIVLERWIKGQFDYFVKKAQYDHKVLKRLELLVVVFLVLGLVLAVVALFFLHHLGGLWHGLLLVSTGMAPVIAALIHGYNEKRALTEHIKQYERMGVLFRRARRRLHNLLRSRSRDHDTAQQLVFELGREALAENGDWVLLHRQRPLEVPKAG